MSDIFSIASHAFNCIVTNVVVLLFYRKIYIPKYRKPVIYIACCVLSAGLMTYINFLVSQSGIFLINTLFAFIYFNLMCKCLYDTEKTNYLLYNTFFLLMLTFSDNLSVLIWIFLKKSALEEILTNFQYLSISSLLCIIFVVMIYRLCIIFLTKKSMAETRSKEGAFLILMTCLEIFIIYTYFLKIETPADAIKGIMILGGFVFTNLSVTYILKEISDIYKYKYELALIKRQNEIQLNFYNELKEKFNQSQKIVHDIKKHLSAVNDLQTSDRERATEYSSMIETKVNELYCCFKCTNQILSIIMSRNILTAESECIKVETRVEDVAFEFVDDMDITAIFANMWDNAIEACRKIEVAKRYINIDVEKINGFILINMENSFDGNIIKKSGEIFSTKSEHEGVGISIIRDTVSKYGGVMCIVYDSKCFRLEITMPVPVNQSYKKAQ